MEAKEIRDLMGAYASMYSQQEEVIAEAECEEEESDEKEAPEMMGKKKGKKEKEKEEKGEKEEVDEATKLAVMARQRAVELGAKRRSTKQYKQGLNRRTGPTESGLYDLSNRQASRDASLETQKMSGDTGAHGQNYADRIDKRDPKKNPKHDANKENINASYEYDLFDYLLEYLVAEGYADTNKAALAIMANMSEEWKQDIMEISDKRIMATRDALAKRTDRSVGRGDGNQYSRNVSREARMNARIQSRNQRTGSNVEPTDTRRHQ